MRSKSEKPIALVTGSDSGIGFETAKELALNDYHVIMASRDESNATNAIEKILAINKKATLEFCYVNLNSLDLVNDLANNVIKNYQNLQILVNNAGINDNPFAVTKDGFEETFQVNYLSHVLLTNKLLPMIETNKGRIVHVTSYGHHNAIYDLKSPLWQSVGETTIPEYDGIQTYFNSKLANLLFHYELSNRLELNDSGAISIAVHPGSTKTNMLKRNSYANLKHTFFQIGETLLGQKAEEGAMPTLHACLDTEVKNGGFWGTNGIFELRGRPILVSGSSTSQNPEYQRDLWDHTCNLLKLDPSFGLEKMSEYQSLKGP